MSEPEKFLHDFLRRWSRRKLAKQHHEPIASPLDNADAAEPNPAAIPPSKSVAPSGGIDPATLPAIESIGAATDIRPFLAAGVPADLTRAALRRAWVSDPAIRDFIGLAENQWDFTKPDGVPGFGSLDGAVELGRIAADLIDNAHFSEAQSLNASTAGDEPSVAAAPAPIMPSAADQETVSAEVSKSLIREQHSDAAPQRDRRDQEPSLVPFRRRHGGALPK
jgi:Protein of unknown function (DUF3306)